MAAARKPDSSAWKKRAGMKGETGRKRSTCCEPVRWTVKNTSCVTPRGSWLSSCCRISEAPPRSRPLRHRTRAVSGGPVVRLDQRRQVSRVDLRLLGLEHVAVVRVVTFDTFALVRGLDQCDLIAGDVLERGIHWIVVEPRRVLTEDLALDRAVGGAELRLPAHLLHQVIGDLEPTQRLDLPLR